MYMDDVKLFAKNKKKELETVIHAVSIYCQDIGMEFGIEKEKELETLIYEVRIYTQNIGMEFGIEKRKRTRSSNIRS